MTKDLYSKSAVSAIHSRLAARQLDRDDPLARVREQFVLPAGSIYLCGNSLGPLPRAARARLDRAIDVEWGQDLVRSYNKHGWFSLPEKLGARLARLIGARADEVTVADNTSVSLFKALCAARSLRPGRRKIVTEAGNFPTDGYVMQGLAQLLGDPQPPVLAPREQVLEAIDQDTAVVCLTHVHYRDSAMFDLAAVTGHAHRQGALVVWDLSHSIGAVPVDLDAANADFAIGCTYKYLNGGPGSPAFIYAASRHHRTMQPGLVGWWGHSQPFEFRDEYTPAEGMRSMLTGTGHILGMIALDAALDVFDQVDLSAVRAKSLALSRLFLQRIADRCAGFGVTPCSEAPLESRGSHVALRHPEGYAVIQALIRRQVIGDFRAPDVMRFGLAPLYLSFENVWDAVELLAAVLAGGEWRDEAFQQRAAVT